MFNKNRLMKITGILFIILVVYFGSSITDYFKFTKIADSASGLPVQDAGKITFVREPCILDTPAIDPVNCLVSCPLVTLVWESACVNFIELDTISQHGTEFISSPVEMVYRGGGTHPVAGMSYIFGGASNAIPWVIGIPSAGASRIQKLVDIYNFIIAGFKSKIK